MDYLAKFILLYLLVCAIAFGISLFNPTLQLFLYIYYGLVILFAIFAFFNLYHILKFGVLNFTVIFMSLFTNLVDVGVQLTFLDEVSLLKRCMTGYAGIRPFRTRILLSQLEKRGERIIEVGFPVVSAFLQWVYQAM